MAFKQPRVPEYRESDGTGKYIRSLVLFLKDFCMDVWTANNQRRTWPEQLLDIYPVGSIYMSVASTSPASLFGGTWESIGGRFLLGADSTYTAGSTGGETTHVLTVSEIPSHIHSVNISSRETLNRVIWGSGYGSSDRNAWGFDYVEDPSSGLPTGASGVTAAYTGGDAAHNNMPPYLAVYMWKRVS